MDERDFIPHHVVLAAPCWQESSCANGGGAIGEIYMADARMQTGPHGGPASIARRIQTNFMPLQRVQVNLWPVAVCMQVTFFVKDCFCTAARVEPELYPGGDAADVERMPDCSLVTI